MPITMDNVGQIIAPSPRITGSVMYAPLNTPLPTASYATVNSAFTDLGYTDENGIKQKEDRTNTDVFAWGGDNIANLQEKYLRKVSFKVLQFLNPNALAAAYKNANISVTGPTSMNGTEIAVTLNSQILDTLAWCFDGYYYTAAGFEALVRLVVPVGRVTTVGDVDFTNKALTSLDYTLTTFPDGSGNHGYLYVNNGITTGGTPGS